MRVLGVLAFLFGCIWAIRAWNMDTTVPTGGEFVGSGAFRTYVQSSRVHNIGLMDERRNHLIGSGIVILAGILFMGFGELAYIQAKANQTPEDAAKKLRAKQWLEHQQAEAEKARAAEWQHLGAQLRKATAEGSATGKAFISTFGETILTCCRKVDGVLQKAAGEDDFFYRFLQVMAYLVVPIGAGIIAFIVR